MGKADCEAGEAGRVAARLAESLVKAGFNWDRIVLTHSRYGAAVCAVLDCVARGEARFMSALLPAVSQSAASLPPALPPPVLLSKLFSFLASWKSRLYELMSAGTLELEKLPDRTEEQDTTATSQVHDSNVSNNRVKWMISSSSSSSESSGELRQASHHLVSRN